jgi:hypothetical protein
VKCLGTAALHGCGQPWENERLPASAAKLFRIIHSRRCAESRACPQALADGKSMARKTICLLSPATTLPISYLFLN